MRALTVEEVGQVSGGGEFWDTVLESTKIGGATGTFIGFVVTSTVKGATRGGVAGSAYGFAWGVGYATGTLIYETLCR